MTDSMFCMKSMEPWDRTHRLNMAHLLVAAVAAIIAGVMLYLAITTGGEDSADKESAQAAASYEAAVSLTPSSGVSSNVMEPTYGIELQGTDRDQEIMYEEMHAGDLGLEIPVDILPCNGQYVVILRNVIEPANYVDDIAEGLASFNGSRYMLTDGGCNSLRQLSSIGTAIYSVYAGPFDTEFEACKFQQETDQLFNHVVYVKELRRGRDVNYAVECG